MKDTTEKTTNKIRMKILDSSIGESLQRMTLHDILCNKEASCVYGSNNKHGASVETTMFSRNITDGDNLVSIVVSSIKLPSDKDIKEDVIKLRDDLSYTIDSDTRDRYVHRLNMVGYSQIEIGSLLGISQSYVNKILNKIVSI